MDAPQLLTHVRHNAGLTQAQLAKRARTSQAAIARYETGASSPSISTMTRIMKAAGARLELSSHPTPAADLSGKRPELLRANRQAILKLARAAGARNVRVFGSVARGQDTSESDIDFLVDFDVSQGLVPIIHLQTQLESLLGQSVDVAPVSVLKPTISRKALAEAVPL